MIKNEMTKEQFADFMEWVKKTYDLNKTALGKRLNTTQQNISHFLSRPVSKNILKKLKDEFPEYPLFSEKVQYVTDKNKDTVPVPLYEALVAAGKGEVPIDNLPEKDIISFDKKFLKYIVGVSNFDSLSIVRAKGDSMNSQQNKTEDIKDKDYLLVDNSIKDGNGKICVILMNGELRVKKLNYDLDGTLTIHSNNPLFKDEILKPNETEATVEVLGKVVWNLSKGMV